MYQAPTPGIFHMNQENNRKEGFNAKPTRNFWFSLEFSQFPLLSGSCSWVWCEEGTPAGLEGCESTRRMSLEEHVEFWNISWITTVLGITEESRKEVIIKYSQVQPPNYSGLRSEQMTPRKRAADSELIIIM